MITAIFNDKMDNTVAYGLWQWDYGQVLRIKGIELPQTAVEVHFSFEENDGDSETVIGTIKNITYDPIIEGDKTIPAETIRVLDVPIPKNFLWNNNKKDYIVCASIYISDEEMGETLKKIILPIRAKPRPVYPHASKDEELFHSTLEQVNEYAQTAIDNAQLSKSYAVGGTNTRENEDVDNAKYYAEQASASSEEATLQADNAEQSANNAKEYEENAELSANKAKEYETSSKTNADNAEEYKNWAYEYKDNAQEYSITTREYRDEAENAKNIALQASIDTGGVRDEVNRTKTQIDENIETINNQLSSATELANQVRADKEIVANNTAITNTNVETTNNNVELTNQNKTATDEALANSRQINEEVVAIKNEIMGFAEDASRIVTESIATHNISSTAHNDIRQLVVELNNKLNTVLDSDDSTLDQLSEIVNYIKDNRDLIETITTSKINVSDIIDNLTTINNDKPLSARQGKILKDLIDAIIIPTEVSAFVNDKGYLTTETQSDWEEINIDSPAYILNKPSIKAGTGTEAIIQGLDTIASGTYSVATGRETTASGGYSHAEGYGSVASKQSGHAEGNYTIASGSYSHAEGYGSIAKNICHAEGWNTNTGDGIASHAEGMGTSTFYGGAHAEGGYFSYTIQLTGEGNALIYTYKEELSPYIINHFTHNGILKIKLGSSLNVNQNNPTHKMVDVVNINTENKTITVKKTLSETTISDKEFQILATSYAYGTGSHAEGLSTVAYGHQSHAGGKGSYALADSSFVSGNFLIGNAQAQTVIGTYNIPDNNDVTIHPNQANEYRKYAFIVGNGYLNTQTKEFIRSNAYTLDWQGNGWYQGKIAINGEPTEDQDVVTKKWVEDKGYLTVHQDISNKADKSEIPIKTSQLINDSNFIVSPTVSGTEGQVLSIGDEGTLIWKDGLKITCTDDGNGTVIINGGSIIDVLPSAEGGYF